MFEKNGCFNNLKMGFWYILNGGFGTNGVSGIKNGGFGERGFWETGVLVFGNGGFGIRSPKWFKMDDPKDVKWTVLKCQSRQFWRG